MDVSTLLDGLNDKQRDAVAAPLQPAGAGRCRFGQDPGAGAPYRLADAGGTLFTLLHHRGDLYQQGGGRDARPGRKVIGDGVRGMWIGTFHGIAHRLLRAHHLDAGLPQDFQILDSDDQYRLIRRVLKALNLDEKHWAPAP